MTISLGSRARCHFDICSLHVFLSERRAYFLVLLEVCLFAVTRAVEYAFACDARLEIRNIRIERTLWFFAVCAFCLRWLDFAFVSSSLSVVEFVDDKDAWLT